MPVRHPLHVDRSDLAYSARNSHSSIIISLYHNSESLRLRNEEFHLMVQYFEQTENRLEKRQMKTYETNPMISFTINTILL